MSKKKSESNIAYIGVDMPNGHTLDLAIRQINDLAGIKFKAYYVDIIYDPKQLPEAMQLKNELKDYLDKIMPWEIWGGDAVTIELNVSFPLEYRARDKMNAIINDHKEIGHAKEVNFKDPHGQTLPIEY